MEETTFLPQLILKLGNSLSSNECQKLRRIKKAIGQNKKSLFLPSNTADRREQGFTSPTMRWGKRQFKEELTSHQTTSIQNPSLGQYRNLKRHTLSLYNPSVLCSFIFAQHLAHGFSITEKPLCSHRNVTAHTRCAPPGDHVCIDGTESQVCWHWFWQALENPSKPPNSFWEKRSTNNCAQTYTGWATRSQTKE